MPHVTSSRWCPTPEQLMILEELYRRGIRTPHATQIQKITAHLSLYGKIEGKNVFYWFQNHKARDRQKLRRKLLKQLQQSQQQSQSQQQQQQLLSCYYHHDPQHQFLSYFDPYSSLADYGHQCPYAHNSVNYAPLQGGFEGTATQTMVSCYPWKMETPQSLYNDMKMDGPDDTTMMIEEICPSLSSPNFMTRPIRTLELFPVTATCLRDQDCNNTAASTSHAHRPTP